MRIHGVLNANSSLSIWLDYIEKLNSNNRNISVENCIFIAKELDLLNFSAFVFIVGGTNGKGTTCFLLERILLDSGYQVGLYTSPHLFKFCERIRVNGKYLSDIEYTYVFSIINFFRKELSLTYFEFITLSALFLFKQYELDSIILEVGLGGRLDATNIVNSDLSIITNIGIDHTYYLGFTRSSISYEKAHIARKNKFIIVGEKYIPNRMQQVIKKKEAILKKINYDWFIKNNKNNWNYYSYKRNLYSLPYPQVSLENVATALTALFYAPFNINKTIIINSIKNTVLPGRFQIISHFPKVILDVAHNPHAVLFLAKKLKNIPKMGKIYVIVGVLKDKDITGMILNLQLLVDYWYFVPIYTGRGTSISQLMKILPKKFNISVNFQEAWRKIKLKVKKEDTILVFGSFYLVAQALNIINLDKI
ncbi:bifunctional tetrahydrofolate synthase/dihydrofolate synthase [Buchnera aphidicola]|uniref:bifunctional tetrahydrofolate synthase/dihydrofolate synthase n=1 Tax=Buchnera aphidicola TaxID=9 RepID=UPI0034642C72